MIDDIMGMGIRFTAVKFTW